MNALLALEDVHARYGSARILSGVDLEVQAGETVALIGRNGAGKTTILNSIFGIAQVDQGSIRIEGATVTGSQPFVIARHGVAVAPQGRRILSNLTVEENLILGGASGRKGEWDLSKVYDLFPILSDKRAQIGTQLSGGQQQMLCIGRALMSNPLVVLLDEPSEGLAPVLVDQLVDALNAIGQHGTGVLVVEQHLSLITRVASRYVAVAKGRSISSGTVADMNIKDLQSAIAL